MRLSPNWTVLHGAAKGGNLEIFERFLNICSEQGEELNFNLVDNENQSILYRAAEGGNFEIFKRVLKEGAILDINSTDRSGRTLLSAAARGGNSKIIQFLLNEGSDPNYSHGLRMYSPDVHGCYGMPLSEVVSNGDLEGFRLLVKYGALLDCDMLLHQAALHGKYEIFLELLEMGMHLNFTNLRERGRLSYKRFAKDKYPECNDELCWSNCTEWNSSKECFYICDTWCEHEYNDTAPLDIQEKLKSFIKLLAEGGHIEFFKQATNLIKDEFYWDWALLVDHEELFIRSIESENANLPFLKFLLDQLNQLDITSIANLTSVLRKISSRSGHNNLEVIDFLIEKRNKVDLNSAHDPDGLLSLRLEILKKRPLMKTRTEL